ncbi:MAG: hypothetical protein AB7O71_24680 [Hyphomicrobiaceae bacterium]
MNVTTLTEGQFEARFPLVRNHLVSNAFDGQLGETHGPEVSFVAGQDLDYVGSGWQFRRYRHPRRQPYCFPISTVLVPAGSRKQAGTTTTTTSGVWGQRRSGFCSPGT